MAIDYLSILEKCAIAIRKAGLGSLFVLVRELLDRLCMKAGYFPLRIITEDFILSGLFHHGGFLSTVRSGHELFLRTLFKKLLKPGLIVIDGGAHIGLYSLIAAKIVGDNGKVFAFEPDYYEVLPNVWTISYPFFVHTATLLYSLPSISFLFFP